MPDVDYVDDAEDQDRSRLYPDLRKLEAELSNLHNGWDAEIKNTCKESGDESPFQNCEGRSNFIDKTKPIKQLYPDLSSLLFENGFLPKINDRDSSNMKSVKTGNNFDNIQAECLFWRTRINIKSFETKGSLDNIQDEWLSWRTRANQQLSFLILQKAGYDVCLSEEETERKALSDSAVGRILRKSFPSMNANSSLSGKSYIMYGIPRVRLPMT